MHQSRPYGLSVQGGELTEKDQSLISATVLRFTNFKQAGELDSLRKQYDLPDGGYFIIQDMGGIFKVIAYKPSLSELSKQDGKVHGYIPMLFSGVFNRCWYREDENTLPLKITEQCRRRLSGYGDVSVAKELELSRFVINYSEKFNTLEPKISGPYFRHTQYMNIKPTLYSGAMGEVMQIVSGYGRLKDEKFIGTDKESIENINMTVPEEWYLKIIEELGSKSLPGYTGFPHTEGQFQCDYRPSQNDLVAFDTTNLPWLVRIQSSGVFAMPLPVVPATATKSFREYILEVGDGEILTILDKFGALPSGETFPEGDAFHSWKRAGVIVKVCESSDFYNHTPMFPDCGWSMNSLGTEAFNTCWTYGENKLQVAYGYKLSLQLQPAQNLGWSNTQQTNMADVYNYISSLYDLLSITEPKSQAIVHKVRQTSLSDIQDRVQFKQGSRIDQDEVDYWDNLEMPPLASHTGNLTKVTSGPLYWGAINPQSMGRLKFPAPGGLGCQSFEINSPDYKGGFVKCDTVVFGTYINDQLTYVKYFLDDRTVKESVESTYDDIMIVGQWEKTETTTVSAIQGYFYTSDYDDRRLVSPNTKYTEVKGIDMGYGNPAYATPGLIVKWGTLSRSRYYKHETTIITTSGGSLDCAICVPKYNRDAIIYVHETSTDSNERQEYHSLYSMADPTHYGLWTYDPSFHWQGADGKGLPRPKTGDYVYVSGPPEYNPTATSDFADSGDWFGVGNGYVDVSPICAKYTDSRIVGNHAITGVVIGGEGPTIPKYDVTVKEGKKSTGYVSLSVGNVGASKIHSKAQDSWYYTFSPVPVGNELVYFQRDVCRVLFGDSEYVNISDENATKERRHRWGFSNLVDNSTHHYFFGVINE